MRHHAAAQRRQVVAAFQAADDAALAVQARHLHHLFRHPRVVGLDQAHAADVVLAVGVEAGRDKDHLRLERVQRRQPLLGDNLAHGVALGGQRHRHVDHVGGDRLRLAVRIERMLEEAHHQRARLVEEGFLGAVAVVDVEVDDGHPRQAARVERVLGRHGDIVEQTEAHRLDRPRVVAGRAHRAEGVVDLAVDDGVGRGHGGAGGALRGQPAPGVERGVAVDRIGVARRRHVVAHDGDGVAAVVALEVGQRHQRRFAVFQQVADVRSDQLVRDGLQARRGFGVPVAHVVALAIGMAVNGCGHVYCLRRRECSLPLRYIRCAVSRIESFKRRA
jgi:hypothetical protein